MKWTGNGGKDENISTESRGKVIENARENSGADSFRHDVYNSKIFSICGAYRSGGIAGDRAL